MLSSETKATESNDNRLDIWGAVGGSIAGIIVATSTLILYCYKKRQRNKSIISPSTTQASNQAAQEANTEILIQEETTINSNVTVARTNNIMCFSKFSQKTTKTNAVPTESSSSNQIPFSLNSPSILDGRELYRHYDPAESDNHSPSSRPFLARS